jgi:hypothetical protein
VPLSPINNYNIINRISMPSFYKFFAFMALLVSVLAEPLPPRFDHLRKFRNSRPINRLPLRVEQAEKGAHHRGGRNLRQSDRLAANDNIPTYEDEAHDKTQKFLRRAYN